MSTQTQKSDLYRNIAFLVGLTLLLLLGRYELSLQLLVHVALIAVFLVISYVDVRARQIPNLLLLPLAVLALVLVLMQPGTAWMRLFGGLIGFVPFALVAGLRPKHRGGSDIKLATLLGLLFGFPNILWVLLVAVLSGGLVTLMLLFTRHKTLPSELAYAPFLCFGAFVVLLVLPFPLW